MNIGNKIKEIRLSKNLTQEQLGKLINKSTVSIRKYESGNTNPPIEVLQRMSDALEVSLNDFISYEEQRNTKNLEDIERLIEKYPQHKAKILDIFNLVYTAIESEFYKPSIMKNSSLISETVNNNIDLYYDLFETILNLSNNSFIVSSNLIKEKNLYQLFTRKEAKVQEISDILNKMFINYLIKYELVDTTPQKSDK